MGGIVDGSFRLPSAFKAAWRLFGASACKSANRLSVVFSGPAVGSAAFLGRLVPMLIPECLADAPACGCRVGPARAVAGVWDAGVIVTGPFTGGACFASAEKPSPNVNIG